MYTGIIQVMIVMATIVAVGVLLWASIRSGGKAVYALLTAPVVLFARWVLLSGDNWSPFDGLQWNANGAATFAVCCLLVFLGFVLLLLNQRGWARAFGVAALAAALLAPMWVGSTDTEAPPEDEVALDANGDLEESSDSEDEPAPTTSSTTTTAPPLSFGEEEAEEVNVALTEGDEAPYQGFEAGQLGTTVNIPDDFEQERGIAAFTQRTLKTPDQVCAWLHEDTPESNAARTRVFFALVSEFPHEAERIANGDCSGYLGVYPKVDAQVLGTTYFSNGAVKTAQGWRQVGPNDVIWVYMARNPSTGEIEAVPMASIRADCANPQFIVVRPAKGQPPAVPIVVPPQIPRKPGEKPKCFILGEPIFEGPFCGTPNSGPEQQNPQDRPATRTPGYPARGHTEAVVGTQEREGREVDTSRQPTTHGVTTDSNVAQGGDGGGQTTHDSGNGQGQQPVDEPYGSPGGTDTPEHHSGGEPPPEQPTNTGGEEEVQNPF